MDKTKNKFGRPDISDRPQIRIYPDYDYSSFLVVKEKGMNVEQITISFHESISRGLINVDGFADLFNK